MNILFVLPGQGRSGGVRVTVEMANRLIDKQYKVRIACREPAFFSLGNLKKYVKKIAKWFQGIEHDNWLPYFTGDTVLFTDLAKVTLAPCEVVIAVGDKTVYDVYALDDSVMKLRYCHENPSLNPDVWKLPMNTIAVSEPLVPLLEHYTPDRVIGVVPNGVSTECYFPPEQRGNGIGLVYNRSSRKAPDIAADVMKKFSSINNDFMMYSFGENSNVLLSDDVIYSRYPSIDEARSIYGNCSIWLVVSRSEGFCLPILEAMACGCAVISTDHDTVRGIISHGENGLIVPIDDTDAFIESIEFLLGDEEFRGKLIANSINTVRKFNWNDSVEKMESVLKNLCFSGDKSSD